MHAQKQAPARDAARDVIVPVRLTAAEARRIDEAREATGHSRNAFVRRASVQAADAVLAEG